MAQRIGKRLRRRVWSRLPRCAHVTFADGWSKQESRPSITLRQGCQSVRGRWAVTRSTRLILVAILVTMTGTAFFVGQLTGSQSASAAASHAYTLRAGDKVSIPIVNQVCTVSEEGGSPELFCVRAKNPRHQVVFFRGSILVWTNGKPDKPAWSGKP